MLHRTSEHEPIAGQAWDEAEARRAIAEIADDVQERFDPRSFWPSHPRDDEGTPPPASYRCIYLGAAGVLWGLDRLAREGLIRPRLDLAEAVAPLHAAYLEQPVSSTQPVPSYMMGEAGILMVQYRIAPSESVAELLHRRVEQNITNPTNEMLWGAPGSMLAALFLFEETGQERWRKLFLDNVEYLWSQWRHDPELGCSLWTQDLYGSVRRFLGSGHGFAGNVQPLLRGAALLDEDRREELYSRCATTMRVTAMQEEGLANWPPIAGMPAETLAQRIRVQWCHGAPGFVVSFSGFPVGRDPAVERLLQAGAELTWQAGPLAKGFGLCHGTAGNGYAFLEMHRRTGEERWLQRARAFAMHSIGQYRRMREEHGRGRYSLWTGDPGLALYLSDCLSARHAFPSLSYA